jgi:hypothetical protein
MPVSDPTVVDLISVDPEVGATVLSMYEERQVADVQPWLRELEHKVNNYLNFVFGGQLATNPEYQGRSVIIELCCQFIPPADSARMLRALRAHLATHNIRFRVFVGSGRVHELQV